MDTAALKGEGGVEKAVGRGGHCSCLWLLSCSAASQVLGLESRSDLVFEEGLLCVAAQMEQGSEVMAEGEGVADTTEVLGYDESLAALWECYFNWSLERWQEESSFKAVKKKVRE